MTKSKKIMVATRAALLVVLLVGTGYILGSHTSRPMGPDDPVVSNRDTGRSQYLQTHRPNYQPYGRSHFLNDPLFNRTHWDTWDPFEEMARMQQSMNRVFNNAFGQAHQHGFFDNMSMGRMYEPSLDIREKADHYMFALDLPGIEKDRIDIKVRDHSITISGERTQEQEEADEENGFYRLERSSGSFSRTIPLPEDAQKTGVKADIKDGVLMITIPKKSTEDKTKVPIDVPIHEV